MTFRRRRARVSPASALALAALPFLAGAEDPSRQWGQWRGPLATGVAPHGDPPLTWSEDRNVRWKIPVPGRGLSTPIVWGDRIFLTTAVPHGDRVAAGHDADGAHDNMAPEQAHEFQVLAVDRRDGSIIWRRTVRDERPHEGAHITGSWASASAITDGERVYASFGSRGLHALDLRGNPLWETDLGDMEIFHGHGEGSSPALHGNTLLVNWDHQGDSFLVALDKRSGKQRWKVARDEITSWSTPLIVEHAGEVQVIVAATKRVRAYDLDDGGLIWECGGLSRNVVASPVAANGIVYVANSYDWRAMLAIRLEGAKGDVTGTDAVIWTRNRDTPYVPSPVLHEDSLCFVKHLQGFLTCVDPATGVARFGPSRLPGIQGVFASPVAAGDRIYVVGRNGVTNVLRRGPAFELLASNRLDDSFSASPAIVGGDLFLRGERNLYAISEAAVGKDLPAAATGRDPSSRKPGR